MRSSLRRSARETAEAVRCHDLVAGYLDAHPDVAEKYRSDQRGEVRYLDVLALAEAAERAG